MIRFIPFVALGICCSFVSATDWPQFRGPAANGISTESNLPTKWSAKEGIAWKAAMPGKGVSSPVVVGDVVYVTSSSGPRDNQLHVLAFDVKTGKELWKRTLAATGSTTCHPTSCMAAPTPVATKDAVYALFATGDLAAFDSKGNLLWYRSLCGDYPTIINQVGMAASPILASGILIVPMDNVGESFVAGIDTKTGENKWKVARPKEMNWVSPLVRTVNGKSEILFQADKELIAYDPSSGTRNWTFPHEGASIATPVIDGDKILVPGKPLIAGKLGTSGPQSMWTSAKLNTGNSSPLLYQGRVYATSSSGVVTCVDVENGNVLFQERVKGPFSAAPVGADGKVYILNEAGQTTVWKAGAEAEILSTNDLGERAMGTPAISQGRIFIRTDKSLFCVGK